MEATPLGWPLLYILGFYFFFLPIYQICQLLNTFWKTE